MQWEKDHFPRERVGPGNTASPSFLPSILTLSPSSPSLLKHHDVVTPQALWELISKDRDGKMCSFRRVRSEPTM